MKMEVSLRLLTVNCYRGDRGAWTACRLSATYIPAGPGLERCLRMPADAARHPSWVNYSVLRSTYGMDEHTRSARIRHITAQCWADVHGVGSSPFFRQRVEGSKGQRVRGRWRRSRGHEGGLSDVGRLNREGREGHGGKVGADAIPQHAPSDGRRSAESMSETTG